MINYFSNFRQFLSDPTGDEESLADSLIHIVVNADNNEILLMDAIGSTGLDLSQLENCYKIAKNRSKNIKKLILENSNSNKLMKIK